MSKKRIIWGTIIGILALILVIPAFLDKDVEIEDSQIIQAPVSKVYNYANDLKNIEEWISYQKYMHDHAGDHADHDHSLEIEVSPQSIGEDASLTWEKPDEISGKLTIIESKKDEMIRMRMNVYEAESNKKMFSFNSTLFFQEAENNETLMKWKIGYIAPYFFRYFSKPIDFSLKEYIKLSMDQLEEKITDK